MVSDVVRGRLTLSSCTCQDCGVCHCPHEGKMDSEWPVRDYIKESWRTVGGCIHTYYIDGRTHVCVCTSEHFLSRVNNRMELI